MKPPLPIMTPAPGECLQRYVGDHVRFALKDSSGSSSTSGWSARLRTTLGRADRLRAEILEAHTHGLPMAGASWRDLPMRPEAGGWVLDLPLAEAGYFKAKAFLLDERGWQHWPSGPDVGIAVHPSAFRTANTIYCAFPRLFGAGKSLVSTSNAVAGNESEETQVRRLEQQGYTVLPASGTLRDLVRHLPHIMEVLGCRILHLLPVNPTPTTYARFGRFGSPYAALDLTGIDPALVVFDKRTTGEDQFRELTRAVHVRGGRVLLDIVINHTGWGSTLQEGHPEWFVRNPDGTFASPGAWGVTWQDLVELKHDNVALWDQLSDVFLTWCRRGVDGFRCDAGYKVPVAAWQYIVARVQQEFPDALFLLEGLGGAWETTEILLTEGGMQWAYSELFQNYSGAEVAGYLDHTLKQNERVGTLIHYSETHDNDRLAKRGRAWSLLRNRLCALSSVSGAFGFTCGVEWLAAEKVNVHEPTGLGWDNPDNLVPELARLNRLLAEHPCFFDGAKLRRLSPLESEVYALLRESAEGKDAVLVLANTDPVREQMLKLPLSCFFAAGSRSAAARAPEFPFTQELLGQSPPQIKFTAADELAFILPAGGVYCLGASLQAAGLSGENYRAARAQAAWAMQAISAGHPAPDIGPFDWRALAEAVSRSPFDFLAAIRHLERGPGTDFKAALEKAGAASFANVIRWSRLDRHRVTPVPPGHWLLIEDAVPFRATLEMRNGKAGGEGARHVQSIPSQAGHFAGFPPCVAAAEVVLTLELYDPASPETIAASIRFLTPGPDCGVAPGRPGGTQLVLLTNGIGGMARMCVDLGRVRSKYDCVLGANLHPSVPSDRHVFAKRLRAWVNADGFISPLDAGNLASFEPGPPAVWHFVANAGDGRTVEIQMKAWMAEGRNTAVFHFSRPAAARATGKQLPAGADVRLSLRVDVEDRNFHWETQRNSGAEHHFSSNTRTLAETGGTTARGSRAATPAGFAFTPASDRQLRVFTHEGTYHPAPEWSVGVPHPVEQSRGQAPSGDAYSPGWFDLPLAKGSEAALFVTAEREWDLETANLKSQVSNPPSAVISPDDAFAGPLRRALRAFVVRRGAGKTIIAGYPWFLDWGRDTLICARGLLAAGMAEDVMQILLTFARFEKDGTLPNTIQGENASNRDTSDAALWLGMVCEELAAAAANPARIYATPVDGSKRTLLAVLRSIAAHYVRGTPNGIRVDPASGLVWSPSHFTWMDTNFPAATPREGYPVEIQALWIRLLRQLAAASEGSEKESWAELAGRATASVESLFWLADRGWYADVLVAGRGEPASQARADDALRSNALFLVSLGLAERDRARSTVEAARRYLVVPGALRSLAPLPVRLGLPVHANDGRLLNNPAEPYWGRYEGDEDTRRKPAYHNGTAWTWTFPVFCEALARAWEFEPDAVAAARAYLGSMAGLMQEGCLGQIPEILDGDAPHTPRGCDAQAWGVTEALRVWELLRGKLKP